MSTLVEPTSGVIRYDGQVISDLGSRAFWPYRKKIQIIFQDPYNSLNPRLSIFEIIGEAAGRLSPAIPMHVSGEATLARFLARAPPGHSFS